MLSEVRVWNPYPGIQGQINSSSKLENGNNIYAKAGDQKLWPPCLRAFAEIVLTIKLVSVTEFDSGWEGEDLWPPSPKRLESSNFQHFAGHCMISWILDVTGKNSDLLSRVTWVCLSPVFQLGNAVNVWPRVVERRTLTSFSYYSGVKYHSTPSSP